MNAIRFGNGIRAIRRHEGLTQEQLGERAKVSRSLISRVERGRIGNIPYRTLRAVGEAAGADVDLNLRWRGEALDRLLDEAHAEIVDAAIALLRGLGWEVWVEVSFSIAGERGSIDVFGWHPELHLVAIGEVKSVVPDGQATLFGVDRKARLAPLIARERGLPCLGVARILFVGESRTSRRRVERHAESFGAAFPVRGRDVLAWLRNPTRGTIAGLLFLRPLPGARGNPSSGVGARMGGRARVRRSNTPGASVRQGDGGTRPRGGGADRELERDGAGTRKPESSDSLPVSADGDGRRAARTG